MFPGLIYWIELQLGNCIDFNIIDTNHRNHEEKGLGYTYFLAFLWNDVCRMLAFEARLEMVKTKTTCKQPKCSLIED